MGRQSGPIINDDLHWTVLIKAARSVHTLSDQDGASLSVFDYLHNCSQKVISFRMLEGLLSFWELQSVEWHMQHGLRLNSHGGPCHPERRHLNVL